MNTEVDYSELLGMQDIAPAECPTDLSCALKEQFLGSCITPEIELEDAKTNKELGKKLLKQLEEGKEFLVNQYLKESSTLLEKFQEKMIDLEFKIKHTLNSIGEYNKIIIDSQR